MKINLEVEVGWISEDHTIDAVIENRIIDAITTQVKQDLDKSLKEAIKSKISDKVDEWIMEQLETFSDKQITVTDKWGDTIEHHESVKEMFKSKFDRFFDAEVDKKGKELKHCTYSNKKFTRIELLLDKLAETYLQRTTDNMEKEIKRYVDREVKEIMQKQIQDRVVEKVTKLMEK